MKIAKLKKAQKEHAATKVLASDVEDANFAEDCVFAASDSKGKWGALLYRHRGTNRPTEAAAPQAFRELIYNRKIAKDVLRSILQKVFDGLENAHKTWSTRKVELKPHFKRYIRKDMARGRIRRVLGSKANLKTMKFLGVRICNPLKYLKSLPKHAKLAVGLIHGDLHPDNIVIDRNRIPHLIDFAWASKGRDVLIDFALLEISVRFMAFGSAGAINLSDQLKIDSLLLDEGGFKQVDSLKLSSPSRREDYARLACVVGEIRKRARSLLDEEFSMQRYLLAQFILLYGLLRYRDYDPYVATRALGLIAARLKKIGLPT